MLTDNLDIQCNSNCIAKLALLNYLYQHANAALFEFGIFNIVLLDFQRC